MYRFLKKEGTKFDTLEQSNVCLAREAFTTNYPTSDAFKIRFLSEVHPPLEIKWRVK